MAALRPNYDSTQNSNGLQFADFSNPKPFAI
jgi:hypothetical protein